MECNKDEALRAKEVAERKMESGDYVSARKLLLKAQRLFPTLDNITQLTAVCEVHCAAQEKINGYDNWYGILQVEQSADVATIRKQYRKLALLLHPDKNKFFGAEAAFKLVGEANRLLTDQAKRSLYDVRCRVVSRGYVSKPVPPQPKKNAGTEKWAANNFTNSAANQKASELTFWTCCPSCGTRYKYLRQYVNRILRCKSCNDTYFAYEVGAPPRSDPGFSFVQKEVPMKAEVGKTATRKEKNSRKDIGDWKNDVKTAKPDTARPRSQVNEPEWNVAKPQAQVNQPEPGAAKSQFEETSLKPSVTKSTSHVRKHKPDVAMTDEKSPSESTENNKKKVVEESRESFEVNNHNDGQKDENAEENDSNISQMNSSEKRKSSRNKRQVSYAEDGTGDDLMSTPTKKFKASKIHNSDGETTKEETTDHGKSCNFAFCGGAPKPAAKEETTDHGKSCNFASCAGAPKTAAKEETTDHGKSSKFASCAGAPGTAAKEETTVMFEGNPSNKDRQSVGYNRNREGIDLELSENSSNDQSKANNDIMHEPKLFTVPDPEFYDFDKDKEVGCFAVNQVWAIYDPADNMPRFYARVKKVFSSEFKLEITWLESLQVNTEEENGSDETDMPIACGRFGNGENEITKNRFMFSHQMRISINRRVTLIYPKKGETWALFRDWDVSWKTDPKKRQPPFKYDIVEIIVDYSNDYGIGVHNLGKVKGFISIFQRAEQHGVLAFHISPGEIYRFSHRVPSFPMNGTEKGVPVGSLELDPAALPEDILDFGFASATNSDKQSFGGNADPSSKAPETEADRMAGPSNRFEEGLSNKICKNLDQNPSLNENKKGASSKENSTSSQLPETKSLRKAEKANCSTEAPNLRRSSRVLHENSGQSNATQFTESKSEMLGSSTRRIGEENTLDMKNEKFQKNQIWAVYGTNDRMPKEYVQIKRIETTPAFRLFVAFLNGCSLPKKNLLHPLCCGVFKVKNKKIEPLSATIFSHQVQGIQVDKKTYEVYPRKGEIWALYKNYNTGQCDIMEVLEEAGESLTMAGLKCVDHSESFYKATTKDVVELPRTEVARFSHQIPAKSGRLRGCWKLDRSAIPGLTIILD